MDRASVDSGHLFDALGFCFGVRVDNERIARLVEELFRPLARRGDTPSFYDLRVCGKSPNSRFELAFEGQQIATAQHRERLVTDLVHHVNRRAINGCSPPVFHAGGVEFEGQGIIFPGAMESGKTTLVAGLVRAGFRYLSDEAIALDRETLVIRPYPKPLSLDPGSWPLFSELEPHGDMAPGGHKAEQWQVPPHAIHPGAIGAPCRVDMLVFPHFEPGTEAALEPLTRAEALVELAKNTFKFDEQGAVALDLLAEVVRPADCYRLTTGKLSRAIELVSGLVGSPVLGERVS